MKLSRHHILSALAAAAIAGTAVAAPDGPDRLVILHTNDTHSQIDPDSRGLGGVARRKVLVDSVRATGQPTLLVDAGDAVQGTLFFSLFRGEVEDTLMNLLGYDIQILGNHEFDNSIDDLASRWSRLGADRISTNYDLRATPLDTVLSPYVIRSFGDRKVGFIGINLDPDGMIAANHSEGVVYLDPVEAANATAWHMRHNERVDHVVVISHIGYSSSSLANDLDLARRSKGIDVIIGGHSHTSIDPSRPDAPLHRVANAEGDTVVIAQNGKGGVTLGEVTIDFNTGAVTSRLIPVDSRLDSRLDGTVEEVLRPYRAAVDSISSIPLSSSPVELPHRSASLVNLVSDMVADEGAAISGRHIDLAIMNRGGIRRGLPEGVITRGMVMEMMPFDNRVVVMDISGRDLAETFDIMASRGGEGVSSTVNATFNPASGKCTSVTINGEPIDSARTYTIATVDYLAGGGDYLTPLTRGTVSHSDKRIAFDAISDWLMRQRAVVPDPRHRMVAE